MIAEQLRKAILQAAIQGKLTEQLPEDGDARDLLRDIQKEKDRLISEGKIKKESPLPEITEDEIPFDIPENWCWCHLQNVSVRIHYGYTASAENIGNAKLLRITDIQDNIVKWDEVPFCNIYGDQLSTYSLRNRDIVVARTGGTIGKTYIVSDLSDVAVFASYLIRVVASEKVSEIYVKYFMESDLYWKQLIEKSQGTGQPNVNGESIKRLRLPLPPISEQHRIVDRLVGILPEIDRLKEDEAKLDTLQKSFPKKMKDSILQSAIRGKLTEQLATDGDARDLLRDIQREKARLVKEGKIKKEKPLPEITEDEIPFDIPENWCWVRLGDTAEIIMGQSPEGATVGNDAGIEFHQGKIHFTDRIISDSGQRCSDPKKIAPALSVLLCIRAPVGIVNITDRDICIGRGLACINIHGTILLDYLYYYLLTMKKYYIDRSTGSTFKAINQDIIKESPFPLPPIMVQQRIVARLNQLLPLCDALE